MTRIQDVVTKEVSVGRANQGRVVVALEATGLRRAFVKRFAAYGAEVFAVAQSTSTSTSTETVTTLLRTGHGSLRQVRRLKEGRGCSTPRSLALEGGGAGGRCP